ncbi:Stigma-specific protein Stig1 [Corchorus olitorius]|uniref:Stigma-specific protein Stig1 n=1 Tax=Corchorus olitorius TaxID=93759 RepID=A0A1R3H3G1_9ROSI|nr:Stigma-specific protein Stig1 [Corchorus olitorius]
MRLVTLFFALSATIAILAATSLAEFDEEHRNIQSSELIQEYSTSLRGVSHFLAEQNLKANLKCDKFPRICRLKNSPGPDCCKKKCVNVKKDRFNCGMCGYKCKYTEICCKGQCVNPSFDKRNCGGCNKKCKKGQFCAYGMCNYA